MSYQIVHTNGFTCMSHNVYKLKFKMIQRHSTFTKRHRTNAAMSRSHQYLFPRDKKLPVINEAITSREIGFSFLRLSM